MDGGNLSNYYIYSFLGGFSPHTKGEVFETYFRRVILYGSETLGVKKVDLVRLERNRMRMIHWIYGVLLRNRNSSEELRNRLVSKRQCKGGV